MSKYIFMGDRMVAVKSNRISVGDKVICMKNSGGLIKPAELIIGDKVVLIPTAQGKVATRSIGETLLYVQDLNSTAAYTHDKFTTLQSLLSADLAYPPTHLSDIDLGEYGSIWIIFTTNSAFISASDVSAMTEFYNNGNNFAIVTDHDKYGHADFNLIGGIVGISVSGYVNRGDVCRSTPAHAIFNGVDTIFTNNSEGLLAGGTTVFDSSGPLIVEIPNRVIADASFVRFINEGHLGSSISDCDNMKYAQNIYNYLT